MSDNYKHELFQTCIVKRLCRLELPRWANKAGLKINSTKLPDELQQIELEIVQQAKSYKFKHLHSRSWQKKVVRIKSFKEEFLLRCVINCDSCGNNMTGSTSRSRNGQYHNYYHCNHCHKVRLTTHEVNNRVEAILEEIKIDGSGKKIYDTNDGEYKM